MMHASENARICRAKRMQNARTSQKATSQTHFFSKKSEKKAKKSTFFSKIIFFDFNVTNAFS